MLFSLAIKNIKKSIKDYSIYFFTLIVAVAIFYTFNSLDGQQAMNILSGNKADVIRVLIEMLNYISIFISIILGFLIVYSNSFLLKRRKKEFGLYLTLGMSKRNVSTVLVLETMLVGILSLGVGLLLGVLLSQVFSIFTIKIFELNMSNFNFVFSINALLKTILYFVIIFILVMIFNVITLSKNKIINLLSANKKNEKVLFRNKYVVFISFIISAILLYYAYSLLFNGAMFSMESDLIIMLVTGLIGTFFLFFSLSGFFLRIVQSNKKFYYKNLNMFITKQINSNANKTVFSTTIICIMLLLTIGILSGSVSLVSVMNDDMDSNNRTDITLKKYISDYSELSEEYYMNKEYYTVNDIANSDFFKNYIKEYAIYYLYQDESITMKKLVDKKTMDDMIKEYGKEVSFDTYIDIMSESDYNEILKLYNMSQIDIGKNEYLLTTNMSKTIDFYKTNYENGNSITINNRKLVPYSKEIFNITFANYSTSSNFGTIIVDDSNIINLQTYSNVLIGNYVKTKDVERLEDEFTKKCSEYGALEYTSKLDMHNSGINTKALVTFISLYLGIIFAISSATVLAIKQLSESNDNKERYLILKQIGADEKMINKSLFTQIAIAFLSPLLVAIIHAYFGLGELNGMIELLGDMDLSKSILLTALFIIIIYGGYFMATYLYSKNIIKE